MEPQSAVDPHTIMTSSARDDDDDDDGALHNASPGMHARTHAAAYTPTALRTRNDVESTQHRRSNTQARRAVHGQDVQYVSCPRSSSFRYHRLLLRLSLPDSVSAS